MTAPTAANVVRDLQSVTAARVPRLDETAGRPALQPQDSFPAILFAARIWRLRSITDSREITWPFGASSRR